MNASLCEYGAMMKTPQEPPAESLSITRELIERAKDGDGEALNVLMARFSPRLVRWATGRLPGHARSLLDTGDLVQDVLISTLERLDRIDVQVPGQFQAYVRKAILNRIRDQVRSARKWTSEAVAESLEDRAPSPLEAAIGSDVIDRYERALNSLHEDEARLLHLRVELHLTYEEIAMILERPSPDAVRMAAQRALGKLAELMGHGA
jgi:RNA polymerase sigma factor (sigma-70 family)